MGKEYNVNGPIHSGERFYVPRRYIVTFLAFLGITTLFTMRNNLGMVMVAMVNTSSIITENYSLSSEECPMLFQEVKEQSFLTNPKVEKHKDGLYSWDPKIQGIILGAFFYGYVLTHLPGGLLSEKYGAKWFFGGSIFISAVFILLTPIVVTWGTVAFICLRICQGLGEGMVFPAFSAIVSRWSPKMERCRMFNVISSGCHLGNILAMALSGWLSSMDFLGGWPAVFYVMGSVGCLWFLLFGIFMHETPQEHPSISKEELAYIEQNKKEIPSKNPKTPWRDIVTSLRMWALVVTAVGDRFGYLIFLTELPTYLCTVLHYDVKAGGYVSAIPYILRFTVALSTSYVADKLRTSEKLSVTAIRKICNSIGFFVPAVCLLGVTFAGCRPLLIVVLISIAMALNAAALSGYNVTHVDMSPDFAGTLYGISNGLANLTGIVGPGIVGVFIHTGATMANWNNVFYTTAAVYCVTGTVYAVFASAELQPWGIAKENKDPEKNHNVDTKF